MRESAKGNSLSVSLSEKADRGQNMRRDEQNQTNMKTSQKKYEV